MYIFRACVSLPLRAVHGHRQRIVDEMMNYVLANAISHVFPSIQKRKTTKAGHEPCLQVCWGYGPLLAFGTIQNMRKNPGRNRKSSKLFTGNTVRWRWLISCSRAWFLRVILSNTNHAQDAEQFVKDLGDDSLAIFDILAIDSSQIPEFHRVDSVESPHFQGSLPVPWERYFSTRARRNRNRNCPQARICSRASINTEDQTAE